MSVHYTLNKKVRVKDLKEKGFTVEKLECRKILGEDMYELLIYSNQYPDSTVMTLWTNKPTPNVDDWETQDLEGHFSNGGGYTMLDMCDKLDTKFITDEDEEIAINTNSEITEETFTNRTKRFYEYFTKSIE